MHDPIRTPTLTLPLPLPWSRTLTWCRHLWSIYPNPNPTRTLTRALTRCMNLWSVYQQMRSPPRSLAERAKRTAAATAASEPDSRAGCAFGAPPRVQESAGGADATPSSPCATVAAAAAAAAAAAVAAVAAVVACGCLWRRGSLPWPTFSAGPRPHPLRHHCANPLHGTCTPPARHLHPGAPLVGRALQSLGALDSRVDVAGLTPASFMHAKLEPDAKFGTPVSIR